MIEDCDFDTNGKAKDIITGLSVNLDRLITIKEGDQIYCFYIESNGK